MALLGKECIRTGNLSVRACNYIKFKTGQNFPPVLKIEHTAHANRISHFVMLLSVHLTCVLLLVQFNNFALNTGFHRSNTLLLKLPFLCALVGKEQMTLYFGKSRLVIGRS